MIKPTNTTPLNMASEFNYHCDSCGKSGDLHFGNFINVPDNSGDGIYDQYCPSCDSNLKNKLVMHLDRESFSLIRDGHKTIEVRLNDEKRRSMVVGDTIKFINNGTEESVESRVIDLLRYPSFSSLLDSCEITKFGSNNKVIFLEKLRGYYSEEDEKISSVVGIKIEVL